MQGTDLPGLSRRSLSRRTFALSLAASTASVAYAAESSTVRGRQLIQKVVNGLGGDAFRTLSNVVESGRAYTFYEDRVKALSVATIYTRFLQPDLSRSPDAKPELLQMQREAYGRQQEDAVLFTQREAYEVTFRGARPLGEERFKQYRETALHDILYILRERLDEPGIEFEAAGADVVENQPVQTINVYDSEDRRITVWVNAGTWIPIKQRYTRWDPTIQDRHEEVTYYSNYRDSGGGVMWPFAVQREEDSEKVYQMFSDKVTLNAPLASSLFELPNGIKILKT